MTKRIPIFGALDTKGVDVRFLKRQIELRGCRSVAIDMGILGKLTRRADVPRQEVSKAPGSNLKRITAFRTRKRIIAAMIRGAVEKARLLHLADRFDPVVGVGGGERRSITISVPTSGARLRN